MFYAQGTVDATRQDQVDAEFIRDVASALRNWSEASGRTPATKVLREAVWFFWQRPRLPDPLVARKYPRTFNWSPDAAALWLNGAHRGQLVIEHIEPMARLLRWLLEEAHSTEAITEALRTRLNAVVVSREESARLRDEGSPKDRYANAGLDLATFAPLDYWERVAADGMQPAPEAARLAAGDWFRDGAGRPWAVLERFADGVLAHQEDETQPRRLTWHALMTIGVRPDLPPEPHDASE